MSKTLELREKRNKLWNSAKELLDQNRDANGLVHAASSETYDKMEREMVSLGHEIERLERQAAFDLELNKPTAAPVLGAPAKSEAPKTGRASNEYRADFLNNMRGKPILHNVLSEGIDTDGGYLVPIEFERNLVQALNEAKSCAPLPKPSAPTWSAKSPSPPQAPRRSG